MSAGGARPGSEPGWYPDPDGRAFERWWTGFRWDAATRPLPSRGSSLGVEVGASDRGRLRPDISPDEAGWYPDPEMWGAYERYWDGARWTEHQRARRSDREVLLDRARELRGPSRLATGAVVWALAAWPLWFLFVADAALVLAGVRQVGTLIWRAQLGLPAVDVGLDLAPAAIYALIALAGTVLLVLRDRVGLRRERVAAPSLVWLLLTPIGYLAARHRASRMAGRAGNLAELVLGAVLLAAMLPGTWGLVF